jgi:putative spermidine/putrescine transport system substrate-binding protein
MSASRFSKDAAQIALDRFNSGEIDRRSLLVALGGLGLAAAFKPGVASAEVTEIVVCNWGGAATEAFQKAYGEPFTKKSGLKVAIDGAGPTIGAIRAMVESGKVIWDTTDGGMIDSLTLGKGNLVEPIDYAIVDKTQVPEKFAGEFGVCNYVFANVLAYDAEATKGVVPTAWTDFFDQEKFPGKRTMCKWIQGQLEFVLLADGVAPADLYPLDVDRAFKKLKPMLKDIIFWEGGAQTQQLLREGEVVMGNIWHTRANLLNKEAPDKFKWTWEQNILSASAWSVPKGNPAGKKVFEFINSSLDPAGQIVLLQLMGNGPSNPKTLEMMTPADAAVNPTTKENAVSQISLDAAFYAANETELQNKYLDFIAS